MNLRQLEVIKAVMDSQSVTGAARMLNVSQPAVTAILRRAEDQLGFPLFDRIKGRLSPTPDAWVVYRQLLEVFARVDAVQRTIEAIRDLRTDVIEIATNAPLALGVLPAIVCTFMRDNPMSRIRINVATRHAILEGIEAGTVSIGFGYNFPRSPRVSVRRLAESDVVCIVPAGHPLSARPSVHIRDMAQHTLIRYSGTQTLASVLDGMLADSNVSPPAFLEVGQLLTAAALVNEGVGVAVVDVHILDKQHFNNIVVRPLRPRSVLRLEMVLPADRPVSWMATSFCSYAVRQFGTPNTTA